jgi:hypothetical protein
MSIKAWGPPIWQFFHVLVENIKEEYFNKIGEEVFGIIKQICKNLPCPDCSMHASRFLSSVKFQHIKNKNEFVLLMYIFHNTVRKKKSQSIFQEHELAIYKNKNIFHYYNQFVKVYKTRGQMKLMADSFARGMTVRQVYQFLIKNQLYFTIKPI